MAASRRGQPELRVGLPPPSPGTLSLAALPEFPPISALFLIEFDVKAGYTLSWKAAQPGVELEGVVEYKSLPSGLHTVSEDLIYFVHDGFAGLSAFVNAPCEDSEVRNARMLAVGVLVPLSYGRLGRAWRHAESLKDMASKLAANGKEMDVLQQYWESHQAARVENVQQTAMASKESLDTASVTFQEQPKTPRRHGHTRNRSASDGTALLLPGHKLSPFHPAWSLTALLDTFGPLIFPIHRAALLRKRILVSGHAPVQEMCNFVYDISIFSNIPLQTYDLLPPDRPAPRLRPLFTVGVHDIPLLVEEAKPVRPDDQPTDREPELGTGWIACTTDSILAMKDTLWDMLITMPAPHAPAAKDHVWPSVECPRGTPIKATQRDLRRFHALKAGLKRMQVSDTAVESPPTTPRQPQLSRSTAENEHWLDDAEQIIEPLSWSALAYNGFMWWASAGEQTRSDEAEESAQDAALLADIPASMSMSVPRSADLSTPITSLNPRRLSSTMGSVSLAPEEARTEVAIVQYFHRLTSQILKKVADVVEDHTDCEDEDSNVSDEEILLGPGEEELEGRGVRISTDALRSMGLDIWSASDAEFVKEAVVVYFGREAFVEGKGIDVCGVRVC
ncbi:uncharacterized protein BCR38DRAFT_360964 [Pseudomassariella vexata]|uniref:DUF4484 domain-containing protein n=1 Tax=Pseudomassariella vexata TaxID=1141098 RepID=A0A1Y2EDW4_9PEZI|nr:uncharacterized protein BCR38DRAFT_360964 [Pseudomassariella vexata]ORY69771.1 hypothetical protein BCR38DRAFT_360964 [Pseudomassariella vexata]